MEKIDEYEGIRKIYESNVDSFILSDLFLPTNQKDEELINDIKNSKIVIYTAFTKGYDSLKELEVIDENCDYICFTNDKELTSDIWDIRIIDDSILDNNRIAKQFKVLPHKYLPEYKYSFWLDGTFKIKGSIREYIYKFVNSKMLCVVHPERDCIYDEAQVSKIFVRYPNYTILKQIETYEEEGMPKHFGLPVLGAIFRKHNDSEIISLMEQWWEEIIKFTNQDQLGFTYLMWKNNFMVSVASVYYWKNEYWTKEGEYHHKETVEDYVTSKNLLKKLEGNIQEVNSLTKEELSLLINDIEALEDESIYLTNMRDHKNNIFEGLKKSKSWKLTKPLRREKSGD